MDSGGDRGWRLTPGQLLHHRQWGDDCVLYNDLSGDTHLLDEGALQVLLALRQGPLDAAALAIALEADGGDADDLRALLAELQQLSLVEPTPC
jgi:PqqD family protein of HPr-rel-A system